MALAITEIIAYNRSSPPISSLRIASWTSLHRLPSASPDRHRWSSSSPAIVIVGHRRPSPVIVIVSHRQSSPVVASHRHRQSSLVAIVIASHRLSSHCHRRPSAIHPPPSASIVIGIHRHRLPSPCQSNRRSSMIIVTCAIVIVIASHRLRQCHANR